MDNEEFGAKAAPVGEREAAIDWYNNADWGNECFKDGVVRGFQAGAAHQRQQAREVVMPERDDRAIDNKFDLFFKDGWNACLDEFARLNKGAGSHE